MEKLYSFSELQGPGHLGTAASAPLLGLVKSYFLQGWLTGLGLWEDLHCPPDGSWWR